MGKAARLFNGNADQTLRSRVTPTEDQRQFLQQQWNKLADYLKSELANYGYTVSTWLQGSYKYGTLIKPVHKGEEYDVDVGIYFEWDPKETNAAPTPSQLRDWVQRHLIEYASTTPELQEVEQPAKERCSRAIYAQQFHIDTPTYHLDRARERRRLACLSGKWEDSDPKKIYKWFKEVVGSDDREQLRRLVRYLKGWSAVAFVDTPAARPSSIFLTVVAAEAFEGMWLQRFSGIADDDALIAIVEKAYIRLTKDRRVFNPVDTVEDINRIPDDAWETFLTRLTLLHDAAQSAKSAEDESSAALAWEEAFSFLMPLPETDEVEFVDASTDRAIMQVPEVDISVYDNDGTLLQTYRNEVPTVSKGRSLKFSIVNPHILPGFADISWTVRNEGEESDGVGDLGHTRRGIGMFSVEESTAYVGRHFMDCVVRLNGSIYAVRRILVNIRPNQQRQIAQQSRAWMKLRTRRGRRK
ncbi:CBASS cGAMP synthase [Paraburkholderia pallida]|uniref:Cyclic GMP-AMP synthase n=1 Tax=Paraburkholderia pallida TaxID=2547399 RepID=A0A4P7D7B3_9BURK|nr:nucleotidyltransferase [Paraburkholderia pallida]QBR02502.1 nucleotidyltransferase [Paraburkholderia pallida]